MAPNKIYRTTTFLGKVVYKETPVKGAENIEYIRKDYLLKWAKAYKEESEGSNQGGIEKGFVDEGEFVQKLMAIADEIRTWGNYIVAWKYCTSNDPNNPDRKPNTGMVDDFRHDFIGGYDFDNRHALMVGDASGFKGQHSDSDYRCAKNAGIRYCDVDKFIEAMMPCKFCNDACYAGEYPCPWDTTKRGRLKNVVMK